MNIPLETILAILAVEIYRSSAQPEGFLGAPVVAAVTLAWVLFSYLLGLGLAGRVRRRLRRHRGPAAELIEDFRVGLLLHRSVTVLFWFAYLYVTAWPVFIEGVMGLPRWSILDDVLAVAPFVAALASGWAASYAADKALSRRAWGLGEYLWFQTRYSLLLVLLPWLLLKAVQDSWEFWPEPLQGVMDSPVLGFVSFLLVVGAAAVFLPVFLKWLFRAKSMPDSSLRRRLERRARAAGFAFRDILVWRMARARVLNAGVMGVVSRYRYVMFSDALLEALSPEECEAVLAHEIGHIKHRHIFAYLLFAFGFVLLVFVAMALMPRTFSNDFRIMAPVMAVLVCVYFRFLFGVLSRRFERQADVQAAGLIGSPIPLVLALEKIALISGDVRRVRSWRHDSVAERVNFLLGSGFEKSSRDAYHRRARRTFWRFASGLGLLFAASLAVLFVRSLGPGTDLERYERLIRKKVEGRNERQVTKQDWARLGALRAERGDARGAADAFKRAFSLDPRDKDVRGSLMGLDLPEAEVHKYLASAYAEAGWAEEALKETKLSIEKAPRDPEIRELLASLYLNRRNRSGHDPEKGLELARKAVELGDGNRPSAHYLVAKALIELGREKEAGEYLVKALASGGDDGSLKNLLEKLRTRGGAGLRQP